MKKVVMDYTVLSRLPPLSKFMKSKKSDK